MTIISNIKESFCYLLSLFCCFHELFYHTVFQKKCMYHVIFIWKILALKMEVFEILSPKREFKNVKIWHTVRFGHLLMPSGENSFFILSQRIQRGDDDRGVSRENDSFFLIFATWAILPGLRSIHKWRVLQVVPVPATQLIYNKKTKIRSFQSQETATKSTY